MPTTNPGSALGALTADDIFDFYDQAVLRPDPALRAALDAAIAKRDAAREALASAEEEVLAARGALEGARTLARRVVMDRLHVKLDDNGVPVPRPGAPTGPRKRKEPETPKEPTTPAAPQEPASAGQGDGFALFAEAVAGRAPQPDLDALGWTADGPGADLTDAQTRVVTKHRISFDDLDTWEDDAPVAFGKAWTMDEPARVMT